MQDHAGREGWRLGRFAVKTGIWLCRSAADVLFPPACPGCGRLIGRAPGLCAACWTSVKFIERPYCDILGSPFSHDLGDSIISADAIANPPDFDHLRSVCLYDGVARTLIHALKYHDRTELAPMMAIWMARAGAELLDECDAILPVPLHRMRMLARRFNQAAELARAVSRLTNKPMLADLVSRRRNTAHQVGLTRIARQANVAGAFNLSDAGRPVIADRKLVLIDDVYTTGATVSAMARLLKRAGAAEVSVLTFARALPDTI